MANLFDSLQDTAFNVVTNNMGYSATWRPSIGGDLQVAKVLYNGPTEKEKLLSADYDPDKLTMEYKSIDFIGLKDAADDNQNEIVTIEDVEDFAVKSVRKKFDGKTFEAKLQRIND